MNGTNTGCNRLLRNPKLLSFRGRGIDPERPAAGSHLIGGYLPKMAPRHLLQIGIMLFQGPIVQPIGIHRQGFLAPETGGIEDVFALCIDQPLGNALHREIATDAPSDHHDTEHQSPHMMQVVPAFVIGAFPRVMPPILFV